MTGWVFAVSLLAFAAVWAATPVPCRRGVRPVDWHAVEARPEAAGSPGMASRVGACLSGSPLTAAAERPGHGARGEPVDRASSSKSRFVGGSVLHETPGLLVAAVSGGTDGEPTAPRQPRDPQPAGLPRTPKVDW